MRDVLCFVCLVAKRNYHAGDRVATTYNDLPIPQGSWKTHHDAQQRKYNSHLLFGVAFAIGTLVIAKASGSLYLNYTPPARPAAKNDYN